MLDVCIDRLGNVMLEVSPAVRDLVILFDKILFDSKLNMS